VAEKNAVMEVLDREYLGMGAEVKRFEDELAGFFSRPVACVVNGTTALQLALQGCGIGPGDEVLVPSLTFVASFQAIRATGARPVACDVDPVTLTLDAEDAASRVTRRTRAVMPVHYSGGVGDLHSIYALAERNGLRVIEDAAHAFGSTYGGRRIGAFGDVACFSFDGIKNITSGEGGCVVSEDQDVLRRVADARLLGVCRDTEKRYTGQRSWEFDVVEQGWRGHMSNIMAAIGSVQLQRLPELAARRRQLAIRYDEMLGANGRIGRIPHNYAEVIPHIYVVRISDLNDREALRGRMAARGVETGVHYFPNHRLTYFKLGAEEAPLPVTDSVFAQLLTLPLHPGLRDGDVDMVAAALNEALDE
jgi:dTDP-4-amino-4,6-dideoxygalactose transaminase